MDSQAEPVFPLMPRPIALALAAEALTDPSRKAPVRSLSADKTSKTQRRHPLFNGDTLSKLYTTPLAVFHFALYGATPFYYLLHCSPFRDIGDGAGDGVLNQLVKWTLFMMTQYVTAVIVVSWSGRYQVRKNTAVFAFMVAGLVVFSLLKSWVADRGAPTG